MKCKFIKMLIFILGVIFLASLALFCFLVFDSGNEKHHLIQQKLSPDGKLIAEIHQTITPQHGGPDRLTVTLREVSSPLGEEVYSRTYECSDFSAFKLQWKTPDELTIVYGECNSGRWHTNEENAVTKSDTVWRGVKLTYLDTTYVAKD